MCAFCFLFHVIQFEKLLHCSGEKGRRGRSIGFAEKLLPSGSSLCELTSASGHFISTKGKREKREAGLLYYLAEKPAPSGFPAFLNCHSAPTIPLGRAGTRHGLPLSRIYALLLPQSKIFGEKWFRKVSVWQPPFQDFLVKGMHLLCAGE